MGTRNIFSPSGRACSWHTRGLCCTHIPVTSPREWVPWTLLTGAPAQAPSDPSFAGRAFHRGHTVEQVTVLQILWLHTPIFPSHATTAHPGPTATEKHPSHTPSCHRPHPAPTAAATSLHPKPPPTPCPQPLQHPLWAVTPALRCQPCHSTIPKHIHPSHLIHPVTHPVLTNTSPCTAP